MHFKIDVNLKNYIMFHVHSTNTCKVRGVTQSSREGKAQPEKELKCYICGRPHSYKNYPELKSLGAILPEWKEQKA